jgi:hypothetical protein
MLIKIPMPIKAALLCGITGALVGAWITVITGWLTLFLVPGFCMGYFFAKAHAEISVLQKKWKSCLIFGFAYIIGLFCPLDWCMRSLFARLDFYDDTVFEAIRWYTKPFLVTVLLILFLRIFLKLHLKTMFIFILIVCGTLGMWLFGNVLENWCRLILGFGLWQGIMGGLLSLFILKSNPIIQSHLIKTTIDFPDYQEQ